MKNVRALSVVCLILLGALVFSGCSSNKMAKEYPEYKSDNTNFIGLVETRPGSFTPTSPAAFNVHSDELYARRNFSGNNVQLLWGLFEFADY